MLRKADVRRCGRRVRGEDRHTAIGDGESGKGYSGACRLSRDQAEWAVLGVCGVELM
jgi:hypothetical protein